MDKMHDIMEDVKDVCYDLYSTSNLLVLGANVDISNDRVLITVRGDISDLCEKNPNVIVSKIYHDNHTITTRLSARIKHMTCISDCCKSIKHENLNGFIRDNFAAGKAIDICNVLVDKGYSASWSIDEGTTHILICDLPNDVATSIGTLTGAAWNGNDNGDLIIECSNEYDDLDRLLTIVNILKPVN